MTYRAATAGFLVGPVLIAVLAIGGCQGDSLKSRWPVGQFQGFRVEKSPKIDKELWLTLDGPNVDFGELSNTLEKLRGAPPVNIMIGAFTQELRGLEALSLQGTRVTDQTCARIAKLPALLNLILDGTLVTNAGAKDLCASTTLKKVSLIGTQVDERGLFDMLVARPDLEIEIRDE